jgi:hypothetical protein
MLGEMLRGVLRGVKLAFSGFVPVNEHPARCELWERAQMYGARCLVDMKEGATHLVAKLDNSEKV